MEVFMVPRATGEYMEREPIETNPHRRLLGRRPSGHSNQSNGSRASTLSRFRSRFFNKPMFYGSARTQRDAKSGTLENGYFGNSTIPVASGTLSTASSSISILSDLIEQMSCVKESSPDGRDKLRALEGPKLSVIGERMELEAEESAQRKQSHIDEQLFEAKYSLGLGI
uniref:Uncharacterized protein n=1 Tax=Plectus sambesii TaxID=2011161 RepID=A0A914XG36_9BILA